MLNLWSLKLTIERADRLRPDISFLFLSTKTKIDRSDVPRRAVRTAVGRSCYLIRPTDTKTWGPLQFALNFGAVR
jgi:hypothetical protein